MTKYLFAVFFKENQHKDINTDNWNFMLLKLKKNVFSFGMPPFTVLTV